jgi:primosomal protein N' (replication factor Y)
MDTDTMRTRGSHERTLDAFRDRQIDILVGTQMIAKGLDFPSVMLVGVVNADAALHLADFRAAERTCQLVTQVAGRSGRGPLGGRVVVQTSTPDHPAIRAAAAHDYEAFVRSELPVREALLYPPSGSIVRFVVRSLDDRAAADWTGHIADRLRAAGLAVFGPGRDGARREASKSWAKQLMREAGVPTAEHWSASSEEQALAALAPAPA